MVCSPMSDHLKDLRTKIWGYMHVTTLKMVNASASSGRRGGSSQADRDVMRGGVGEKRRSVSVVAFPSLHHLGDRILGSNTIHIHNCYILLYAPCIVQRKIIEIRNHISQTIQVKVLASLRISYIMYQAHSNQPTNHHSSYIMYQ